MRFSFLRHEKHPAIFATFSSCYLFIFAECRVFSSFCDLELNFKSSRSSGIQLQKKKKQHFHPNRCKPGACFPPKGKINKCIFYQTFTKKSATLCFGEYYLFRLWLLLVWKQLETSEITFDPAEIRKRDASPTFCLETVNACDLSGQKPSAVGKCNHILLVTDFVRVGLLMFGLATAATSAN